MRDLHQVLDDLDLAHLQVIASQHGLSLKESRQVELALELAVALLEPGMVERAFEELTEGEREALSALYGAGGKMRAHLFFHRYGPIRPYGPSRLQRERPWTSPSGPTESLWYKGFIGRAFVHEGDETPEFLFIPRDILPRLGNLTESKEAFRNHSIQSTEPNFLWQEDQAALEDVFQLLLYIQLMHPKADGGTALSPKDIESLHRRLQKPEPSQDREPSHFPAGRLGFLLHLCRKIGIVDISEGRFRLSQGPAREWLEQSPSRQLRSLADAWRNDAEWNDLWRVRELLPEATGWENEPLRARSRFLSQLADLPAGEWLDLSGLLSLVKDRDPDFARPDGDYQTWYIRDAISQELLLGFEKWDLVEGRLIRYYVTGPMHWLGLVDLGATKEDDRVDRFRLTDRGTCLLINEPESDEQASGHPLLATERLELELQPSSSLYHRLQLHRFAAQADVLHPHRFRVTASSLLTARKQGLRPAAIQAFLEKISGAPLSQKAQEELQRRWNDGGSIRVRHMVALEYDEPEVAEAMLADPVVKGLAEKGDVAAFGRQLVIDETDYPRFLARLRQMGVEPRVESRGRPDPQLSDKQMGQGKPSPSAPEGSDTENESADG